MKRLARPLRSDICRVRPEDRCALLACLLKFQQAFLTSAGHHCCEAQATCLSHIISKCVFPGSSGGAAAAVAMRMGAAGFCSDTGVLPFWVPLQCLPPLTFSLREALSSLSLSLSVMIKRPEVHGAVKAASEKGKNACRWVVQNTSRYDWGGWLQAHHRLLERWRRHCPHDCQPRHCR